MSTTNYFFSCSKKLLNQLSRFLKNEKQSIIKDETSDVDTRWLLISTTLLLSENLLKKENIYNLLEEQQFVMLENLIEKSLCDSDYQQLESYFLNAENQEINPLHNLIHDNFDLKKYLTESYLETYLHYGSNAAIITNNTLDYKKLIIRIRNAIAHSNYEIIDDNYLRIYHYNEKTNKLDMNIKINKIIVLTIIDEINEFVANLYKPFLNEYIVRDENIQYSPEELSDNEIIEYILQYKFLTKEECQEILEQAKTHRDYYPNFDQENNYNKFSLIYEIIFEKIKPSCDYGVILNEILFDSNRKNKTLNNYFYEKYGYYSYFTSDLYESSNYTNKNSLRENKFKIILLSLLNSFFLYNYNNNSIDYLKIDFSKIKIAESVKKDYINRRYKNIRNSFKNLEQREKVLDNISKSITRLEEQQEKGSGKNEFLSIELPTRIKSLKDRYQIQFNEYQDLKKLVQIEMYNKLFEISDFQSNTNMNGKISEFIFNHLRNSLAHGYITFPHGINLKNIYDTQICFEDYEKDNKEILTFQGSIKIGELLELLNKEINIAFYDAKKSHKQ